MVTPRDEPASGEPETSRSLPLDLQAVAYEELGETPQLKRDTVQELRKLISAEQDLRCPTDDAFLVKFLRARKYRVDDAFRTIRKYFRFRQLHRDLFDNLLPSRIMFDAITRQSKMLRILEERDQYGRAISILKPESKEGGIFRTHSRPLALRYRFLSSMALCMESCMLLADGSRRRPYGVWSPEMCNLNEVFRAGIVIGELCMLDETTQVAGVVGVLDLEGLGVKHFRHYTPSVIKKFIQLAQDCHPMRMKGLYITNNPPIFELIYSFAKMFLNQKLINRIHFIGRDYEKLHKLIPRERLPEEYDGTLRNYDYDDFERRLQSMEDFFVELDEYGYREQQP